MPTEHSTGREAFRVAAYQASCRLNMEPSLTWTSLYQKYFQAESCFATYFTADSEFTGDSVIQPMRQLQHAFASELRLGTGWTIESPGSLNYSECGFHVIDKGDTLVFYGFITNMNMLFPACDFFKEITIMDVLDTNLQYAENWLKHHPKAFNWTQCFKSIEVNEEERQKWITNEEKLRRTITMKNFMKLDLSESGPVAPKSFPQVDCLLCPYTLTFLCKDHASFISTLKNMTSLLKVGGHLILFVFIQCTYLYIADFKLPILCINDDFVKNVLSEQGFLIKEAQLKHRVNQTKISVMDFSHIMFLVASKVKDV